MVDQCAECARLKERQTRLAREMVRAEHNLKQHVPVSPYGYDDARAGRETELLEAEYRAARKAMEEAEREFLDHVRSHERTT